MAAAKLLFLKLKIEPFDDAIAHAAASGGRVFPARNGFDDGAVETAMRGRGHARVDDIAPWRDVELYNDDALNAP